MIYNYLSDDITQDVVVDNIYDIVEDIYDEHGRLHRGECIQLYVPGWIEQEIVSALLEIDDFFIGEDSESISLFDDDDWCIVSIWNDGKILIGDIKSGCDNKIYSTVETLNYVYDEMKKPDLSELEKYKDSILVFGFEQDGIDDDCHCDDCDDYGCPYNEGKVSVNVNGREIIDKEERDKYIRNIIRNISRFDGLFGF